MTTLLGRIGLLALVIAAPAAIVQWIATGIAPSPQGWLLWVTVAAFSLIALAIVVFFAELLLETRPQGAAAIEAHEESIRIARRLRLTVAGCGLVVTLRGLGGLVEWHWRGHRIV